MKQIKELYAFRESDKSYKENLVEIVGRMHQDHNLVLEIQQDMETLKDPVPWRAAWILSGYCEKHPKESMHLLPWMAKHYITNDNEAILRQFGKILGLYPIADEYEAIISRAFDLLCNRGAAVAVRVHAMQIAYQAGLKYPELHGELIRSFDLIALEEPGGGLYVRMRDLRNQIMKLQIG